MTEIGKIVGLKCPNCGAALPETDKDLQKCKYCGMTVHIEDANKYLEHLKGFIIEWMRTALPLGIGTVYSSSVDPLARHNIFVQSILPRLNSEFGMVQIDAFEAFSTPLIAPPFIRRPKSAKCQRDTKSLFSYDAKIASIQPFAISPEDQTAVQKMGGISRALAHVLIGLDVLNQNHAGSYKVVAENFAVASKSLEPQYEVLSQRLNALSEIYLSIDELLSRNVAKTRLRVNQAIAVLEDAKSKSACDINLSICTNAIEEEIEVGNTVLRIADLMESMGGSNELDVVSKIERFFQAASSFNATLPINWRNRFENVSRYSELTKWLSLILNAKRGSPTLKTTYGPGNTLFPFWGNKCHLYIWDRGSLDEERHQRQRERFDSRHFSYRQNLCLGSF